MMRVLMVVIAFLLFPTDSSSAIDTWAVYDGEGFMHISGSGDDFRRIGELKHRVRAPFIYLRDGREAWVIKDIETVRVAREILREPDDLRSRRWALEVAMLDLEREEETVDRRSDRLEGFETSWTDARREQEQREIEALERVLERSEAQLDEIEREYEHDYEHWEEDAERKLREVVRSAVDRGLGERLR